MGSKVEGLLQNSHTMRNHTITIMLEGALLSPLKWLYDISWFSTGFSQWELTPPTLEDASID